MHWQEYFLYCNKLNIPSFSIFSSYLLSISIDIHTTLKMTNPLGYVVIIFIIIINIIITITFTIII